MNNSIEIYRSQDGSVQLTLSWRMRQCGLHKVKWQSCLDATELLSHVI